MKKLLLTTALASVLLSAPAAFADEKDDRIKALEEQLSFLAGEIQLLKEDRATEKAEVAALVASIKPSAGKASADNVKITMGPSPKFSYGDFSFQPFGRIHLDYAVFSDDAADHPNGAEFRRARLGMKGTVAKDFGYKVQVDFANEGVNFKDVYMNYTGFDNTEIRLGSFKPGFSMEELTSANYITFIERSAPVSAFGTGEVIGLASYFHGDNWSLTGGAFVDEAGTNSTDDEAWSVAARGTFAPVIDENVILHLGASATHRKPDQANESFDFDATAENSIQRADSVSANFANVESANLYGLEAALVTGPFSAQGEYFVVDVDRDSTNSDLDFSGAYAQLAWTITGESRPYKASSGTFGRIVPARPFDPKNGGWGAWELAGRYSTLDVSDGNVLGGEMDSYTIGLNWYMQKHVRLMANYISVDTDRNAVTPNDDPDILLFRAQVDF